MANRFTLHCSFCGKSQYQVRRLVQAPKKDLLICNECVELCGDIIREEEEGSEHLQL